ncbi:MAG: P-II family nitrogen regulator [Thermoanaerobaculia bacterium]
MSDDLRFIIAFIQPFQLENVLDAVRRLPSFPGMTVTQTAGIGRHLSHPPRSGEETEVNSFMPGVRIEIYCLNSEVPEIVRAIREHARTGRRGDGKIFTGRLDSALRIRSGEEGPAAIHGDRT